MRKIYIIGALACFMTACKPSVTVNTSVTSGSTKFTQYLAIGNSLTAGFADNSLYVTGQLNSYPQRLFEQFQLVPGSTGARGSFIQPLLDGNNGYPTAKMVLGMTYSLCDSADSSLGPISYPNFVMDPLDAVPYVSNVNNGQINNIGVPGIRVVDYPVEGYATPRLNPYAARFYHNTAGTPMDELSYRVNNLHPTFFTMWLGANDVLGYALAGGQGNGTGNALPLVLNLYNSSDISPTAVFQTNYDSAVNLAISTGSDGALINIPDITSLPFFTTIPADGLQIARQSLADSLKAFWSAGGWNKVFQLGLNYFVITDHNGNVRQAIPGELILLTCPMDSIKCRGWGSYVPIPSQYVLTTDEIQNIEAAIKAFNAIIYNNTHIHHLAYVDMNSFMSQVASGFTYNGINYSTQFVTGGAFSLDGIHLTPRGYALVANKILQTINATYKSTLPNLDVNKYDGIQFP